MKNFSIVKYFLFLSIVFFLTTMTFAQRKKMMNYCGDTIKYNCLLNKLPENYQINDGFNAMIKKNSSGKRIYTPEDYAKNFNNLSIRDYVTHVLCKDTGKVISEVRVYRTEKDSNKLRSITYTYFYFIFYPNLNRTGQFLVTTIQNDYKLPKHGQFNYMVKFLGWLTG